MSTSVFIQSAQSELGNLQYHHYITVLESLLEYNEQPLSGQSGKGLAELRNADLGRSSVVGYHR